MLTRAISTIALAAAATTTIIVVTKPLVYWTIRSYLWGFPGRNKEFWDWDEIPADGSYSRRPPQDRARWVKFWTKYAAPFLSFKGYHLYKVAEPINFFIPSLLRSRKSAPLNRRFIEMLERDDDDALWDFGAPRIWPAQDNEGRDVIIKFVPHCRRGGELDVLVHLNSAAVLQDGFNFSVPVVDYVWLGDAVFIVMERWGDATTPDYATVADFVHYGRGALQALAFFHRHDITHGDIWSSNLMCDIVIPRGIMVAGRTVRLAGFRGPERRYALIDFETARVGASGEEAEKRRKEDVSDMALLLEMQLRCLCVEGFVPEIDGFLNAMIDKESPDQPNAAAALARFEEICSSLTEKDMQTQTSALFWNKGGRHSSREGPAIYSIPPRDAA